MRNFVCFYLNGERHEVRGEHAFWQMSDYLRYANRTPGTKVVCAEGDCGACTLLRAPVVTGEKAARPDFRPVNSCIAPVFLFDSCHVVSVEGLGRVEGESTAAPELHPVQKAMVQCNGGQCGYCTPGFVMAMTGLFEQRLTANEPNMKAVQQKTAQKYLTGNLCRCTGYQDILDAACAVKPLEIEPMQVRYATADRHQALLQVSQEDVAIEYGDRRLFVPTSLQTALQMRHARPELRIVSGATDLGVQVNKERLDFNDVMSLNLVPEMHRLETVKSAPGRLAPQELAIGAKVNLATLTAVFVDVAPEFAKFLAIFASPQIKNMGTLAGNVINGSPIADATPCLMTLDTEIELTSVKGVRRVLLADFYLGYKKLDMRTDELVTRLFMPLPARADFLRFYKISQRRDLDISGLNAGFLLRVDSKGQVEEVRVVLGGVGPKTWRLRDTEAVLQGRVLTGAAGETTRADMKAALLREITPISDVRGTREFRQLLALNLVDRLFAEYTAERGAH